MTLLRRILPVAATAALALAVGVAPAQAAPGDRIEGDGTGRNAILGTDRCSGALVYSVGVFDPYVNIQREAASTTGICDVRTRVSYVVDGRFEQTGWVYGRDYMESKGPETGIRCAGYVGLKRNDGTWLSFVMSNQSPPAACG